MNTQDQSEIERRILDSLVSNNRARYPHNLVRRAAGYRNETEGFTILRRLLSEGIMQMTFDFKVKLEPEYAKRAKEERRRRR